MLHHFSDTKAKMTLEGFWCSYSTCNLLNWCPCRDRDGESKQRVAETCPLPTVVWSLTVTCRYEAVWFKRGGWICFCWVRFLSHCIFYTPARLFSVFTACLFVCVCSAHPTHLIRPHPTPRDSIRRYLYADWSRTCRSTWNAFQTLTVWHNFALPSLKSLWRRK